MNNPKIIDVILIVYEKSKDSKLCPEFLNNVDSELKILSEYFMVTNMQSLFISLIFVFNHSEEAHSSNAIARHLDLNIIKILQFSEDFIELTKRGLIIKRMIKKRGGRGMSNQRFIINPALSDSIINNESLPELKQNAEDVYEVLENIGFKILMRSNEDMSTEDLFTETAETLKFCHMFPLIAKVDGFALHISDKIFLLSIIWEVLNVGNETTGLLEKIDDIFERGSSKLKYEQSFINGNNELLTQGHLELIPVEFFRDADIKLSEQTIDMLRELGFKIFTKKKNFNNLLQPADIKEKNLVFNEREKLQTSTISKLLCEENLVNTQKRLEDKNLPTGVTCLLYGSPGTGKTEFAMQIAKQTSRAVFKVDISQAKSMWLGESEKIVKRIFTDYKKCSSECERIPILLFNEADAILSTRTTGYQYNQSVNQTLNAVQNIILEELENFKGILIATTNLEKNLDPAFERRFLYKVQFNKPNIESKVKIWKLKIPYLKEEDYDLLAQAYDFSGGEIDNIVRKVELNEILNGELPHFKNILEFCDSELIFRKEYRKIGF